MHMHGFKWSMKANRRGKNEELKDAGEKRHLVSAGEAGGIQPQEG